MVMWRGLDVRTIGDLCSIMEKILERGDQDEADAFMQELRAESPHADVNVGYCTGYFSPTTMQQMQRLFRVEHPIFGRVLPEPGEAYMAGQASARGEDPRIDPQDPVRPWSHGARSCYSSRPSASFGRCWRRSVNPGGSRTRSRSDCRGRRGFNKDYAKRSSSCGRKPFGGTCSMADDLTDQLARFRGLAGIHDELARSMYERTGKGRRVWCRSCGASLDVDAAECLRSGWPQCCGQTMTIDPPDDVERALAITSPPRPAEGHAGRPAGKKRGTTPKAPRARRDTRKR